VLAGPIARLAAYGAQCNSELVHTLRGWLDCFGDVADAAALAYVHPNTFR
jgi:DNA-binding PucR family transcriptional regulator